MDFADTLASIMGNDANDDRNRQLQGVQQHPPPLPLHYSHSNHHHPHHPNGVDFSHSHPQVPSQHQQVFDIASFPSHLNHFRGTPDSGIGNDSPVQHNLFADPPLHHGSTSNDFRHQSFGSASMPAQPPSALPRLNMMGTSPSSPMRRQDD